MVNTHKKFPVDAKHNTYYAADGSDIRDATREEIEKYSLAALHKRKKPDLDAGGKSESPTSGVRLSGPDGERPRKTDDRSCGRDSCRNRGRDRGSRNREAEKKDSHTSSREAKREKGASSAERRSNDGKKDDRAKEKEVMGTGCRAHDDKAHKREKEREATGVTRRTTETKKDVRARAKEKEMSSVESSRTKVATEETREKDRRPYEDKEETRSGQTGVGELEEDERDRRNMEEIQRRMEGRRVAKELEAARTVHAIVEKSVPATPTGSTSDAVQTADACRRRCEGARRTTYEHEGA